MERTIAVLFGSIISIFSVVFGLWLWTHAAWVAETFQVNGPEMMKISVRCLSVGLLSGAQLAILAVVVSSFYRPARVDRAIMWITGSVFSLTIILAVAFGIAGR